MTRPLSRIALVCLVFLVGCASKHDSARLQSTLTQILDGRASTGAWVSARVVDPKTGRELYAHNADRAVIPASNMKLLATAAAVDRWDGDHTFKTYLAMKGDDLWIIGTGDPGIGDPTIAKKSGRSTVTVLEEWSQALRARGVTQIKGKLIYDDSAFQPEQIHPTWHKDDLTAWYAAPISGLNFNDNCIDITVWPTEPGQPVKYEVTPPVKDIKIINNCITGEKKAPDCERAANDNVFTLVGGCTAKTTLKSRPVTNPGAFFADALRTQLEKDGILVSGSIERASAPINERSIEPTREQTVAVHETKLSELLPRINKNPQNMIAEGLCKLLGREFAGGDGSWKSGYAAISAFLERHNIDASELDFVDSSGLSNKNRVSAQLISDILLTMHRHPRRKLFFDSLGVGGVDGTIDKRFTDHPNRVHAKTGYIGGVRSLSGYVQTDDKQTLIFSFIYNGIKGTVKPYEELQDEACRYLMSYPKLDYQPKWMKPTTAPATTTTTP